MNRIFSITLFALLSVALSSCLTGGFDENPQLEELEAELQKAPKVESIKVNGSEVERNTLSRRVVEAKIGDVLNFEVVLSGGRNAQLEEMEFSRVYYYGEDYEEDPLPVDPATNGYYELSGATHTFTYAYTVPAEDDDGYHFDPGYTIQTYVRVKNSLGNYAYRSIEILIVE